MSDPITSYVEQRLDFGADSGDPPPGVMFVFMLPDGTPVAVDFLCPCGCGRTCYTPVTPQGSPRKPRHWVYSPGPTLEPSIRYLGGCETHFNVTAGKVVIHGDSGK